MAQRIAAKTSGVMLDRLLFEAQGSDADGRVEAALGLNPGLAAELRRAGHHLAIGRAITPPEPAAKTARRRIVTLWS